jgi:hypothetical protein
MKFGGGGITKRGKLNFLRSDVGAICEPRCELVQYSLGKRHCLPWSQVAGLLGRQPLDPPPFRAGRRPPPPPPAPPPPQSPSTATTTTAVPVAMQIRQQSF